MKPWRHWPWLLLLLPIAPGLARLRFDVEVLNLLPAGVPAVQGLKIYQEHFANARELIITVQGPTAESAEAAAGRNTARLRFSRCLRKDIVMSTKLSFFSDEATYRKWIQSMPGISRVKVSYQLAFQVV